MSDAFTQTELVTKETSVQAAACSKCSDFSPGALLSVCTGCRQVEDLIHQVARGAELERDTWVQNHAPVEATNENEAHWTLVICKSRTPLQPPPSSITTKNKYESLTTIDIEEQDLQEKSMPAAHSG